MKRIALISFMMILLCMLAFSVSAEEIPSFTEVVNVTVDTSSLATAVQTDNSSRVLLKDENGKYATYLTKYITQFKGGSSDHSQFFAYFDALNTATGKNYDVTSIVAIEIPEGTQRISNTYSKTSTWTNVTYVKAPSTLVYQQGRSYNGCSNLKVLDYSQASIPSLEQELITNNGSVEVVYFPKASTTIGKWAIHGLSSLKCAYISGDVESAESLINNSTGSGKFVFFYTGDIDSETGHTNLYTILGNSNVIEAKWDAARSDSSYIDTAKTEGKIYIVYGYSECNAFNSGVHDNKQINNCVNACTVCGVGTVSHVDQKSEKTTVAYENGFMQAGIKHTACSNEGCGYSVTDEAPIIFFTEGYSIPEDGRGGIAICFTVNKEALADYEFYNCDTLQYGAFAVAYNNIGENNILEMEKAVCVDVDRSYASFEMKLTGFTTEAKKNAEISMGMYVIDKNGNVTYLQPNVPSEGEKYAHISYNSILNQNV